jgi:hypothetical protein
MLEATCVAGVVTSEGVSVPAADVLSEGVAQSSGILFLDEDKAKYVTSSAQDLKTTIEDLIDILGDVASALSSIDGVGSLITTCGAGPGSATWVPVATASIAAINTGIGQLTTLKENLK